MHTPVTVRRGLPDRMQLSEIRRLISDVHRCETWSYYASVDADRAEMFQRQPAWCIDFSEVRGFVERSQQHIASLHLFDYVLNHTDDVLFLLPGTLFEIINYLDSLLLRQQKHPKRAARAAEIRDTLVNAPDPQRAVERILDYVLTSVSTDLEDVLDMLKRVEPAAERLQLLLNSRQIRYFHASFKNDAGKLFSFPGYFDQVYRTLNAQRNARTINNYNDALNLTMCYSANMHQVNDGHSFFVYVTRDRACMVAAERHPWDADPIHELDTHIKTPLCRDPYSALLYIGDKRGNVRRADKLYLTSREFLAKLTRTPEYRKAVIRAEKQGETADIEVHFDPRMNESHRHLRDSLVYLLRNFGTLVFRVLEDTDHRRLQGLDRPVLGEYPERPLPTGTQSLEKLSATFGIVYKEFYDKAKGAQQMVSVIDHAQQSQPTLEMLKTKSDDFGCYTHVVRTNLGRAAVICTVDKYADYYSLWWSSTVGLWAFLDVITFFWNRAVDAEASRAMGQARPFLEEEEKVFPTGLGLALYGGPETDVLKDVEMVELPHLIPLTEDSVATVRRHINERQPFSVRLNTRCGDFWFNLRSVEDLPARMGIISHWWDVDVIAKIVTSTNLHFVSREDLRDLLRRVE